MSVECPISRILCSLLEKLWQISNFEHEFNILWHFRQLWQISIFDYFVVWLENRQAPGAVEVQGLLQSTNETVSDARNLCFRSKSPTLSYRLCEMKNILGINKNLTNKDRVETDNRWLRTPSFMNVLSKHRFHASLVVSFLFWDSRCTSTAPVLVSFRPQTTK